MDGKLRAVRAGVVFTVALAVLWFHATLRAQNAMERGTILGSVTADEGTVRGFRVTAHNLDYRVWYTVYTKDARYRIPQALPGSYEVSVVEEGYQSLVQKGILAPEQTLTADIAVTRQPPPPSVTYLDYDQLYPPAAGRDLLEKTCMGCHSRVFFHMQRRSEAGWRAAIRKMRWDTGGILPKRPLGRMQLSATAVDSIVQYLAANFGPDSPVRDLKREPIPRDEDALSRAIFVEYEIPENMPGLPPGLHPTDAYVASDKSIWVSIVSSNAMIRLSPAEVDPPKRWKVYIAPPPVKAPYGIAEDSKGHIYFAELVGTKLGEIDPAIGSVTEHETPSRGGMHSLLRDSRDNIWYTDYFGSTLGKLDRTTGLMSSWATPTVDAGTYGLAQDLKGNIWTAGSVQHLLFKFDPVAEVFTEYQTPTATSGPRRLRVDSQGLIWFTETIAGKIGSIDPATGKITEYKLPLRNDQPHELWLDTDGQGRNIIWSSDLVNGVFVRFDRKANTFTYYPLPQPNWDVGKVEVESNHSVWFATHPVEGRKMSRQAAAHFYPRGYSADAPPEP